MYTQCSNCATLFRLSAWHLRKARGLVRCCLCHETFDALPGLVDELPASIVERYPPVAAVPGQVPPEAAEPAGERPAAAQSADEDLFLQVPEIEAASVPAAAPAKARRRGGMLGWSALILLLVAAMVGQYAYVMREELARFPRLRPWIESLCSVAGCELPPLRDVARIRILDKHVALHPTSAGILLVKAVLVNDTGFWQPYPQIRFNFLDPVGDSRASRWFAPDEYLADSRLTEVAAGMPPQEPVSIRLELQGMGAAAIDNFAIDFR